MLIIEDLAISQLGPYTVSVSSVVVTSHRLEVGGMGSKDERETGLEDGVLLAPADIGEGIQDAVPEFVVGTRQDLVSEAVGARANETRRELFCRPILALLATLNMQPC